MPEFLQLMEKWDGYTSVDSHRINESDAARFLDLVANKDRMPPHRHEYLMKEAITTSDFPSLFGFTLERDMLARYRAVTAEWRSYCKVGTMPNFNQGEIHKLQGNDTLLPQVAEKGEYLVSPMDNSHYHRRVYKWGRQFDISWEALVNDALNAFDDIPERFAESVRYTRAYNVTDLIASAAGPDVGLFGAPIADVDLANVTNLGALPLTIANLQTTLGLMASQVDVMGRPLGIRGRHLVVPPMLEMTARSILTSAFYTYAATAAAAIPLPEVNVVSQLGIQLHVDPLLPVIDTSGNKDGTWYLFADLGMGAAIQMDFLRGYEDPEICMKASDKVTVAGGSLTPFSGDFATDNVFYRVRDVHGGTRLDPRMAYAQVST